MSEDIFYVYQLRLVTEVMPFYVGKGKGRRAWDHLSEYSYKTNSYKNSVIRAAISSGVEILVEKIFTNLSSEDALAFEVWAIAAYGRRKFEGGFLTNQTLGGEGRNGDKASAATRELLRVANIGRKHSESSRAKMRIAQAGKTNSPECRRKISESNLANKRHLTEEHKAAISAFQTGRPTSEETKLKMSESMTGLKRSEEGKQNMRDAHKTLPKTKCPHCDVWAIKRQLSRYHNDNCKSLKE